MEWNTLVAQTMRQFAPLLIDKKCVYFVYMVSYYRRTNKLRTAQWVGWRKGTKIDTIRRWVNDRERMYHQQECTFKAYPFLKAIPETQYGIKSHRLEELGL